MELNFAYYGDPVLRKKTKDIDSITEEIRQLVEAMKKTMITHQGCGLAAPQVHRSLSLFITCIPHYKEEEGKEEEVIDGEWKVFINPKIISYSKETWICQEGCLSIPKLREQVERPLKVTIEATDLEGKIFREEFQEFDAHVIMHENDHLNGVLYIDRLPLKRRKELEVPLKKIKKQYSKSK